MIAKRHDIFRRSLSVVAAVAVMATLWGSAPAEAQYREDRMETGKMRAVENPDIIARPDAQLPLGDTQFTKLDGTKVKLGELFNHGRPVILSLVYFSCPNLCGLTQDSLANSVREGPRSLRLGKDYDIVVVSIDPDDTLADAATKRVHYLELMNREGIDEKGLTYLTGTEANIQKLADAVGFPYRRNFDDGTLSKSGKYAHSSGIFICTQYGRLSQTILGVQYNPDMVHVALTNAAGGKIGSGFLETVSIPCGAMRFNPKTGQYEANPWFWAGTAGALASLGFVTIFLGLLWRGEFKRAKSTRETPPPAGGTPAVHL